MKLTTPIVSTAVLLSVLSHGAQAAETSPSFVSAGHVLGVGLAHQKADSELRASVQGLPDVKIDLDDLGVDDSETSWALEYRWRFAPRWMLVGLAYRFDESGDQTVKRDFNFDGKEFTAGLGVDTGITVDTYILDVLYSVYQKDRLEILLGGGIHALDLDASIKARAFVEDGGISREAATSDLLAPLPNLRLQIYYQLAERWAMGLSAGWLSANYEDYDGDFAYVHPRVAYSFGNRWFITAGYQYVDLELTHKRSRGRELEFNTQFQGPTLLLDYRF